MNQVLLMLSLLTCLTLSTQGFAQEKTIEISGTVIDADSKDAVPYVHVINKSSGQGVISNTEGRFHININRKDTIFFSAIGFDPYAFTIQPGVSTNKLVVTITLNTSTMELKPVKVFAYKDEYALKKAMIAMNVPLETENEVFVSGWSKAKNTAPGGGISIGGPISALYNTFSRDAKAKQKLQKYKKAYDYEKMIRAKYNENVVHELTGLPEDKVEEFMKFCKLQDSFIDRSNAYEIAVAVNKCLTDFISVE